MKYFIHLFLLLVAGLLQAQQKDFYLLIGQSNMAGRGDFQNASDSALIDHVFLLNDEGEFEAAKNPLNRYSTIRKVCEPELLRVGLGGAFANEMSLFLKDSVYLIVNARGGTPIDKFQKGADNGYYETTLNRTINALNNNDHLRLRAILWHQGESDSDDSEDYLQKLKKMVLDFRQDLDMPTLPFVAGELGQWNQDYDQIIGKIKMIPQYIDYSYVVSSKDLTNRDSYHFDTPSYKKLGKRYAYLCQEVIYNIEK